MAKTYLEPEEVGQLEEATDNLRDRLLIRLLFRLGCRISEVLGIGEEDIDFRLETVTIQHLKVRMKLFCPQCHARLAKTAKFCPGCGDKVEKVVSEANEHHRQRVLPVDRDTMSFLKGYIDHGGLVEIDGRRLLFDIKRRRAADIVSQCAARAGLGYLVNPETGELRGISPHRLRDAFAVMAVKKDDSGDGLRLLQEHLGHQNITTTMRYRKVSGEEQKEWYERMWQN
ncbi:MAG: tyrosine-type recombinase/integrase [Candidatus Omnitrophica bacterium]|nr:tyrosine-type recombinase/integrase [Candidatus Omnitrophota bacterium]